MATAKIDTPQVVVDIVERLDESIRALLSMSPVFFDLVSFQENVGKIYNSHWIAANEELINSYQNALDNYLYVLKLPSISNERLSTISTGKVQFENFIFEKASEIDFKIDFNKKSLQDSQTWHTSAPTEHGKKVDIICAEWKQHVLTPLNLGSAILHKISFKIGAISYIAALLIGLKEKLESGYSNPLLSSLAEASLWQHALQTIAQDERKDAQRYALQAAAAQVMARNMSHNFGSHVISKLKHSTQLTALPHAQTDNVHQYAGQFPDLDSWKQIANFNEYLKTRMDFLADITMATPVVETAKEFCRDIIGGFLSNPLLVNRISGIDRNPRYEIEVWTNLGGGAPEKINFAAGRPKSGSIPIYAAMPNDVLGIHAFYVILENIIRNTYKHAKGGSGRLKFIIYITDGGPENKDKLKVQLFDNVCKEKEGSGEYVGLAKLVDGRNDSFDAGILDETTMKLRSGGLGSVEMDVCAAYLRKISIEDSQGDEFKTRGSGTETPMMEAFVKPCGANNHVSWDTEEQADGNYTQGNLAYRFYLLKPSEVLIVSSEHPNSGKDDGWIRRGVKHVSHLEVKAVYPHQIILQDEAVSELHKAGTEANHSAYTRRIVKVPGLAALIKDWEPERIISYAWERYGAMQMSSLWKQNGSEGYSFSHVEAGAAASPALTYPNGCIPEKANAIQFINHGINDKANAYAMTNNHQYKSYELSAIGNDFPKLIPLVEMAATKIAIIDERVQSFVQKENCKPGSGGEVPFTTYYKNISVFIPDAIAEVNLNKTELDEAALMRFISEKSYCEFIFIHLGLVEKLMGNDKTVEKVRTLLLKLSGEDEAKAKKAGSVYDRLVVISGRGTPETLPYDCRYFPLSGLQLAVETLYDKWMIVASAFNARCRKPA